MPMSKNQLKRAEAEMQKTRLIFKKNTSVIKQSKALARKVASLSPQNMAVAIFSFFVMAASGVHKKGLRNMLESLYTKPKVDTILSVMNETQIEECRKILREDMGSEAESQMEEESDPLLEEMANLIVEFEPSDSTGRLTVKNLNESAKIGKAKLTVEDLKRQRFYKFLKIFEEKLASLNIVEDSEITKFLLSMTNAVHRVKFGNRVPMKKSVSNGHGKSLK
jgi:hypothetical protein